MRKEISVWPPWVIKAFLQLELQIFRVMSLHLKTQTRSHWISEYLSVFKVFQLDLVLYFDWANFASESALTKLTFIFVYLVFFCVVA